MKIERKKRRIKIKGRNVPRDRTFHSVALADEKERERRRERKKRGKGTLYGATRINE